MSKIPATIRGATERLSAIGSLVQASEWERAAIVAAFVATTDGKGQRNATSSISPVEFAKLGIVGLKSKDTVRRYHDAWMQHSGYERPKPGEYIPDDLPEWGEVVPQITNVSKISTAPGTVAEALKDPAFAAKVMQASTPAGVKSMQKAANEAASAIPSEEWEKMRDRHEQAEKHREGRHPLAAMDLMDLSKDILAAARKVEKIALDNATLDPDAVEFTKVNIIDSIGVLTGVIRTLTGNADWDSAFAELSK
jgi:uncharacterized ferredoxin-like protein